MFHKYLWDSISDYFWPKRESFVIFYGVLYAKQRLTCIFSAEAPNNDLVFLKQLEKMEKIKENLTNDFKFIVNAALQKMGNHTWYLSERLVGFSFLLNY